MLRKRIKLLSILLPVLAGVFAFASFGDAATCGGRSAIGNSPPYWGSVSSQNVTVNKGSQVRLSLKGEDGCAGKSAEFQIKKGGSLLTSVSINLNKGAAVSGQQEVYVLYGDLAANFDPGTYQAQLIKVDGQIFQSNPSSNNLVILGTSQSCILSKAYTAPNGGKGGDRVQFTVEGQGTCQDWGVTITAYDALGPTRVVFSGSSQKFTSSSTKLQWGWTLPNLTAGQGQAPYYFIAHAGTQNLQSPTFLVTSSGTTPPGGNTGTGGTDQTTDFKIDNPLKGGADDLAGLVRVLAQWLFNLSIPIAVIMIIYAGILFLTAQGNPTTITKAKNVLWYAVVGLAIILIGSGFVTLIQSILDLGAPSGSGQPTLPTQP